MIYKKPVIASDSGAIFLAIWQEKLLNIPGRHCEERSNLLSDFTGIIAICDMGSEKLKFKMSLTNRSAP
ncbi:hypothetical protein DJ568_16910 [Mucilaginibacter hurinus]|uniref:Uncharacterized protein n=1 Tax=Mucilaginibacter hurinus TaxID=2201324 RepID=A0A367GJE2_9SPHI|nr:hypothetical protein DJ568_16910 [Mucilaginibacter hurinus]